MPSPKHPAPTTPRVAFDHSECGLGLVQMTVSFVILATGLLGLVSSMIGAHALARSAKEINLANIAMVSAVEEFRYQCSNGFDATVAELAGLTPPKNLQGQSMVALLKDPSAKSWEKDHAFTISRSGGESIRTDDWRFTHWGFGAKGEELYDRKADPGEFTNLAKDPKYAEQRAELKARLEAKRKEAGYDPKRYK